MAAAAMVINSSTAAVCVCGNPPLQIVSAIAKLPQLLQKPFSAATWEQERGTKENLVFSAIIIFFLLLCGRLVQSLVQKMKQLIVALLVFAHPFMTDGECCLLH
jgi:hypothetical protein